MMTTQRARTQPLALSVTALLMALASSACPNREIHPLIGEDPEIAALLGTEPPAEPSTSPLAAARRLHQALVQQDSELVWTLLATPTRRALDERGATIGTNGRELLDASTLPGPGGTVNKVRYETLFFGPDVVDLTPTDGGGGGDQATVFAVAEGGKVTELRFVREDDGWKLLKTTF